MGVDKYRDGFSITVHESALEHPLKWHKSVPTTFIESVFGIMNTARQHTFQVLTKRPSRAAKLDGRLNWTPNIWLGTSIESEKWLGRLAPLKETGAQIKFLSLEPLLGPLPGIRLEGIDWVIVGGESGPGARPMQPNWVREIRDNCLQHRVPFFFKQWGGVFKKKTGRTLDNEIWDQMPERK